jgi:hypothetical protein
MGRSTASTTSWPSGALPKTCLRPTVDGCGSEVAAAPALAEMDDAPLDADNPARPVQLASHRDGLADLGDMLHTRRAPG